mgnify:CR=1 FL=1
MRKPEYVRVDERYQNLSGEIDPGSQEMWKALVDEFGDSAVISWMIADKNGLLDAYYKKEAKDEERNR